MELRKTPLYHKHLEYKGRMVDFSGWALPVEYESMLKEAKVIRQACGIFDVSHMGEILVQGSNAFSFLQQLTSNDISLVRENQMQYNLFLNTNGGIIDDFMLYCKKESFLCVVNASNKDKVFAWLKDNAKGSPEIIDESQKTALISIQGPGAGATTKKVFTSCVENLEYMHFTESIISGKQVLISRSGYTGEDGFEIYIPWEDAPFWWDKLMDAGASFGIKPCGLGARDILRIEAGYPLYGYEIDDTTNPYEASLGWAVKLSKNFIAKEKILAAKQKGLERKRIGFLMQERALPRQSYVILSKGKPIGRVSSGTYSPNLDKFIGMGYVESIFSKEGTNVDIQIRDKFYRAKIAQFPFVRPAVKNNTKIFLKNRQ